MQHTCVESFHELEDDVINGGRVLDGRDKGHQLALHLPRVHSLGGVKARKHGSVEMQQHRLKVKYFGGKAEPVCGGDH